VLAGGDQEASAKSGGIGTSVLRKSLRATQESSNHKSEIAGNRFPANERHTGTAPKVSVDHIKIAQEIHTGCQKQRDPD